MPRPSDAEADAILAQLAAPSAPLVVRVCRRSGDRTALIRERLLPRINGDETVPGVYLRFGARPATALREALANVATETTPLPTMGGGSVAEAIHAEQVERDRSLVGALRAA